MALADAAADAGIGLTLLPVLYERAGFDGAVAAARPAPLPRRRARRLAAQPGVRRPRGRGRPRLAGAAQRGPGDPLGARGGRRLHRRTAPAGARVRRPDPRARVRAARRAARLRRRHRPDARRLARVAGLAGRALAAGARHARRRRRDRRDGRQRRGRRHLPGHRGQPGRRLHRRAGLARRRRRPGDRLGQQRHAQLARGTALAGVRPAPAAASAATSARSRRASRAPRTDAPRARSPTPPPACSSAPARAGDARPGTRRGASSPARAPTCW